MTPFRRFLPVFAFVAGFLVLGYALATLVLPHGRSPNGASVGGPFALTAPDGRTVTEKDVAGRPYLVFFGYTHCPDVCPASLAEITAVFKALGADTKVNALFITVDPARDTPAAMKDYMENFDPRIIGLAGTPEQTTLVEREFKAYSKKVPDKDGTYTMDHTAITYLMDKNGQFVGAFNLDRPANEAATELKGYL